MKNLIIKVLLSSLVLSGITSLAITAVSIEEIPSIDIALLEKIAKSMPPNLFTNIAQKNKQIAVLVLCTIFGEIIGDFTKQETLIGALLGIAISIPIGTALY